MSVDDRLRRGLEANATSIQPAGEVRLRQVHARRRRRTTTSWAAGLLVAALLGGGVLTEVERASTVAAARGCSPVEGQGAPADHGSRGDDMDRRIILGISAVAVLAAGCDSSADAEQQSSAPHSAATSPASAAPAQSGTAHSVLPRTGWNRVVTAAQARRLGMSEAAITRALGRDGELPLGFRLSSPTYTLYSADDRGEWSARDTGTASYDAQHRLVLTSSQLSCPDCEVTLSWQGGAQRVRFDRLTSPQDDALTRLIWLGRWRHLEEE